VVHVGLAFMRQHPRLDVVSVTEAKELADRSVRLILAEGLIRALHEENKQRAQLTCSNVKRCVQATMAAREAAPPTSPPKLTPDADAAATLQRVATLQRLLDGTAGSGILPVRRGLTLTLSKPKS